MNEACQTAKGTQRMAYRNLNIHQRINIKSWARNDMPTPCIYHTVMLYGPVKEAERVRQMFEDDTINGIDNLMPACRACNFYKGVGNIEQFRQRILGQLDHTCRQSFQVRLAMQYGIIRYEPWDGKFYFERNKQ